MQLVAALNGRLWTRVANDQEHAAFARSGGLISSRLIAGRSWLRVRADDRPEAGFSAAEATLEDVYFAALIDHGIGEAVS